MTHFLVAGDHFVAVLFLPPVCPPVWIFSQVSSDLPLLRSWRFLCCNMDWGEHCDYGLALTPGFVNLLFCSELRSLQRRKPIPCFVLRCCSSSKITFWLTIYFPNLFVMWCRWWLGGGGGGDEGCYYLAPPLLYMDVKRKCHFLGISFWVIFFEPKCHQEDVSGGPLYLSSYPLKTHMRRFSSCPIPRQAIFFGLLWVCHFT